VQPDEECYSQRREVNCLLSKNEIKEPAKTNGQDYAKVLFCVAAVLQTGPAQRHLLVDSDIPETRVRRISYL
jgi:hypothetical protein